MSSLKLKGCMTHLSVNLNKVALLRNQRDVGYPDLIEHSKLILEAGAHGLTIHPRPDERHIRKTDVSNLSAFLKDWRSEKNNKDIEFNIEGYPTEDFMALVLAHDCDQVTLVPDSPSQRTSDHGWDVKNHQKTLKDVISRLQDKGRRVSVFIDPVPEIIEPVKSIGADRVELYTGPYATKETSLDAYIKTAQAALEADIKVNAGHDLSLDNLGRFITNIPECAEVSIGHAITNDALIMGWHAAVNAYLMAITYGQKAAKEKIAS